MNIIGEEDKDVKDVKINIKSHRISTENKKFNCTECGKVYATKGGLNVHRENVHEGMRWICDTCEAKFKTNERLKTHIRTKHKGIFLH